jgi:hypothetical protein
MENFDEQPLDRPPVTEPPTTTTTRKSTWGPIALIAAAGLILGGGAAWWWTRGDRTPPSAATNSTEAVIAQEKVPERTLPPVGQMDTFLRALLGALSSHPDFVRWLATDDLIRQLANGIDRIARGQSPAADLSMLRPSGDFAVSGRRNALTIDPASYQRYDRLAALAESLEPRGVADAYLTIRPRLDEAYRALGRSEGGSIDEALDTALQRLIETPIPADPIALVPGKGATFAFRDPALEQLTPIQKQLLRMGPENARRIQARLRAIRSELTKSDNRSR